MGTVPTETKSPTGAQRLIYLSCFDYTSETNEQNGRHIVALQVQTQRNGQQ
jgi:hypothetical protein